MHIVSIEVEVRSIGSPFPLMPPNKTLSPSCPIPSPDVSDDNAPFNSSLRDLHTCGIPVFSTAPIAMSSLKGVLKQIRELIDRGENEAALKIVEVVLSLCVSCLSS